MGSVNPSPPTKTAFWQGPRQDYLSAHLSDYHDEVLYQYGEYVVFAMMWRAEDHRKGLVDRCHTCVQGDDDTEDRIASAYGGQPDRNRCPDCYGTGFEGGLRATVIRPSVVADLDTETVSGRRGEYTTDTVAVETTSDIFTRTGDYLFRSDGTRYRMAEMNYLVLRSGFNVNNADESVGGLIPAARLEEETSVAFLIPPSPDEVADLLDGLAAGRHIPADIRALDEINGPLEP